MKLSKYILCALTLCVITSLSFAENYICEMPAILEGVLTTSKSDPAMSADEKAHNFPALQLKKAISVGCQANDEFCSPEQNVSILQLVLTKQQVKQFNDLKGKTVRVNGKLFHSENGNHYTNVLMTVESISNNGNTELKATNLKQETVTVVRNSISGGEDGFSFKANNGKTYYVATNPDFETKGANFVDDRKSKPICLTFDKVGSDNIVAVSRGACK